MRERKAYETLVNPSADEVDSQEVNDAQAYESPALIRQQSELTLFEKIQAINFEICEDIR